MPENSIDLDEMIIGRWAGFTQVCYDKKLDCINNHNFDIDENNLYTLFS